MVTAANTGDLLAVGGVIGLPLLGAALMLIFGPALERKRREPSRVPGFLCTALVLVSFVAAIVAFVPLWPAASGSVELRGGVWFRGAEWGFLIDRLSAELMLLVACVGSLVHVYSITYMKSDGDQHRYFGALNFFIASMQLLVLANNYLLMFAGWEAVGLASYLLIGFHYERWRAGVAAMKAFVINRASDAALLLAVAFLLMKTGTTHFASVASAVSTWSTTDITLAASLLLVGAIGKSAQFPLHIWLPDAMEGPTPVSALIHSATMVCAGVYLIARSEFIFTHAPQVNLVMAIIGTLTAFLAATIALVENDIKRVLAYSTVSQIGFMFLALGVGARGAALFHLFTHAFFKSLLFLGAGSIIHALDGEQHLKHMGGLRKALPATFITMLAASFALSAAPPFAGFFSKDAILEAALGSGSTGIFFIVAAVATSLLTACYAWRLMFLVFYSRPSGQVDRVHESPAGMLVPMFVLSLGCIAAGWVPHFIHISEWPLMLLSTLVAAGGAALAWRYYIQVPEARAGWDGRFQAPISFLRNRWYIDALYEEHLLNGIVWRTAYAVTRFDGFVLDTIVDASGTVAAGASRLLRWIDQNVVDRAVRVCSYAVRGSSSPVRAVQTGLVQTYALLFISGLIAALGYYLRH